MNAVVSRATSCALIVLAASCTAEREVDYVAEIETYRAEREARLRAEDGWLTLIGLFWLEPGSNAVGSDPAGTVVLPADVAPERVAVIDLDDERLRLIAEPGAGITLRGEPVTSLDLAHDASGDADVLELGRLRFHVVKRGDRFAVRVKDPESPARLNFRGLDFFPVDPAYRVRAELERHAEPVSVEVPNVLGTTAKMYSPGTLQFELNGKRHRLAPLVGEPQDRELFLIFRDETSGDETYGAGRYLYASLDRDRALVDFNKAYNPPCAFTAFATCPLPPPGNTIDAPVRAGERAYHAH